MKEIKEVANMKQSKFQYIPQMSSYKSEEKRNNAVGIRERIKTNPVEERGKGNSNEINSFTKRIRAYKTPLN